MKHSDERKDKTAIATTKINYKQTTIILPTAVMSGASNPDARNAQEGDNK